MSIAQNITVCVGWAIDDGLYIDVCTCTCVGTEYRAYVVADAHTDAAEIESLIVARSVDCHLLARSTTITIERVLFAARPQKGRKLARIGVIHCRSAGDVTMAAISAIECGQLT